MFIKPEGPQLTSAQALELDDSYFGSRPFGYFSSRIASLISSANSLDTDLSGGTGAQFAAALGLTGVMGTLEFNESDRELQIATDSFALRHHSAEALVRLYHGLAVAVATPNSAPCTWAAIAEGPKSTVELVNEAKAHLSSPVGLETFWQKVLPPNIETQVERSEDVLTALNVMGDWLKHAMNLLVGGEIDINAGHNKVKHGLAIRSRDDLRVTITKQAPNADGTIPLSALTGASAIDIFDTPTLDFLARPPKVNGRKQGLEVSSLKLTPAILLAEAWMMSVTHAAMFHIAAALHFEGREGLLSAYPALPLAPTPKQLLGESIVGIRHPVTTPPDGGEPDRGAGIAFRTSFIPMKIDFASATTATVVDG